MYRKFDLLDEVTGLSISIRYFFLCKYDLNFVI